VSRLSVPISADDHIQGKIDSPCQLVEYGDYECPACGEAYPIVKKLQKHFGERMVLAFRNFPLTQIHPWAEAAAEVAEFAADHGKFWEMHDLLYENQESFGEELFKSLAADLGLPADELQATLANYPHKARIRTDFTGGIRSGVNGTPTFFVNGKRNNGPFDFDFLRTAIEDVLK